MPDQGSLTSLLADLRALRGQDRRVILAALSPAERERVAALSLRPRSVQPVSPAATGPVVSEWLHARLTDTGTRNAARITASALEALRSTAGGVGAGEPRHTAPRGRSLLGALGNLLTGGREAR